MGLTKGSSVAEVAEDERLGSRESLYARTSASASALVAVAVFEGINGDVVGGLREGEAVEVAAAMRDWPAAER